MEEMEFKHLPENGSVSSEAGAGNDTGGNGGGGKENREAKEARLGWRGANQKSRTPFLGSRGVGC